MTRFLKEEEEEEEADWKPSIVILEQPASHQHRFPLIRVDHHRSDSAGSDMTPRVEGQACSMARPLQVPRKPSQRSRWVTLAISLFSLVRVVSGVGLHRPRHGGG